MIPHFHCHSCGSGQGRLILDLGLQPLANNLLSPVDLGTPEPKFPLRIALCESCWLLQITDIIPPVQLFSDYLYFSSFSDALLRHAKESVDHHIAEFRLGPSSYVVEIASNDGYLLRNFVEAQVPCLGIEPATNIAKIATERGIPTLNRFFGVELAQELSTEGRQADLIIANNVFAHVPNINGFVAGLAVLLKPNGYVAIEFPYGCDLIEHLEFDTIYHEHVFYFTVTALKPVFERHGLELFHVEHYSIHGGSLRIFAAHRGAHPQRESIANLLAEEEAKGVSSIGYYQNFGDLVRQLKDQTLALLHSLREQNQRICAYGASAKGSTLMNYYGIGRDGFDCIDFVVDRSTAKHGKLTPGSHLPILPVDELQTRFAKHALLLTWNFADEILRQQQAWRDSGGQFIIPVPKVRMV